MVYVCTHTVEVKSGDVEGHDSVREHHASCFFPSRHMDRFYQGVPKGVPNEKKDRSAAFVVMPAYKTAIVKAKS